MRITKMIDPRSFVHAGCYDHKGVSVPFAGRISAPPRLVRILGEFASVGPYGAHSISPLELLKNLVREDIHLQWVGIDQRPRGSHGIAGLIRVRTVGGGDGPAPSDGFLPVRGRIG